jgi:hypothetical protein
MFILMVTELKFLQICFPVSLVELVAQIFYSSAIFLERDDALIHALLILSFGDGRE